MSHCIKAMAAEVNNVDCAGKHFITGMSLDTKQRSEQTPYGAVSSEYNRRFRAHRNRAGTVWRRHRKIEFWVSIHAKWHLEHARFLSSVCQGVASINYSSLADICRVTAQVKLLFFFNLLLQIWNRGFSTLQSGFYVPRFQLIKVNEKPLNVDKLHMQHIVQ